MRVLDKEKNLITGLVPKEIESLIKKEVLSGGMLPKIQAALLAAKTNVNSVHIIDGRVEHALLLEILTDQGECLSDRLFVQGMFFQQLRKQGRNYFLESEARMVHYDPPKLSKNLPIFVVNGLSVGAVRAEDWWWPLRSAYAFAFPFVATAHWIRAFRQQMRIGASISQSLKRLIAAIPLAFAWGMGESAGAILGRRRVEGLSWRSEVKPVSIESVAAFESASQIHSLPAKAVPTLSPTEN
mgnify:CR=1 FL=1